jgi:hypothetical protein
MFRRKNPREQGVRLGTKKRAGFENVLMDQRFLNSGYYASFILFSLRISKEDI